MGLSETDNKSSGLLQKGFNDKERLSSLSEFNKPDMASLQKIAQYECFGTKEWPKIDKINAWMLTAETATFMKWGGLGMVASELPENFNKTFKKTSDEISIITPMYEGNTGKKRASVTKTTYTGAEGKSTKVTLIGKMDVIFADENSILTPYPVDLYQGSFNDVNYIFLRCKRFFSITPSKANPSEQDGCYVLNQYNINEVERFAFFSKAIWTLLNEVFKGSLKTVDAPNILLANDWHSGALGGLCKYLAPLKAEKDIKFADIASHITQLPIIHIAHHLGYQGWDYANTERLLNALYEENTEDIIKNAKPAQNDNPRTNNALLVYDCYNQVSSNVHLADRVVTVSNNYMEEVSNQLCFGFDFRDVLKIRKEKHTFFGIVNGYEKSLISPNEDRIKHLNEFFSVLNFKMYTEDTIEDKEDNKKECLKLLSLLATDEKFKKEHMPLVDMYKFKDVSELINSASKIPFICATSRLVEQKGYDIACDALSKLIRKLKEEKQEFPVIMLGGAGDVRLYEKLKKFKKEMQRISFTASKRIFVFRGYKDEFAYALQLATDFYLMPSRFEPCGLTQMEAMAKGSLPITTSTGGLVDTIENGVNGFRTDVFFASGIPVYAANDTPKRLRNNINAYADTLEVALDCFYHDHDKMRAMQKNAMQKDFSWSTENGAVYKYHQLLKTGSL